MPELITLVQIGGLASALEGRNRGILEHEILPGYLRGRRWFAQKGERDLAVTLRSSMSFSFAGRERSWLIVDVRGTTSATYSLPVVDDYQAGAQPPPQAIISKLRRSYREGFLLDSLFSEDFIRAAVEAIRHDESLAVGSAKLCFRSTPALLASAAPEKPVLRLGSAEQSNTSAMIEEWLIIKFYRKIAAGTHPEIEMGAFLTNEAHFPHAPAMYGSIALVDADGTETALGIVHAWIRNQGDGWSNTLAYLDRFLQEQRVAATDQPQASGDLHSAYIVRIEQLARRTAEFHRALYVEEGDPAFVVRRVAPDEIRSWGDAATQLVTHALAMLERSHPRFSPEDAAALDELRANPDQRAEQIHALAVIDQEILISRHHGDYHLGQTLVVQNDIYLVDFEGPPQLSLEERRSKHSIIRDVASMLRSFDYAAWTALDNATANAPDRRNELREAVLQWRSQVSRSFLDAYVAAIGDCPLWPQDAAVAGKLLSLFLIEKAALEIEYEVGNRPAWAGVPLAGLRSLLRDRPPPDKPSEKAP